MKGEAKALALGWGCRLLMGVRAAPHRYHADMDDMIVLVLFGLSTLFALAMTVRFLYRLVTIRGRTAASPPAANDHEETASESP
ncbi:hypothetical protein [Streptomyces sp. t39]|uniref:hypothetical protein n=1 Tax=Streptomyces sp. t39 TaxID=1828156 RepID=UPI0011CD7158|nr:hypothetical protein [Streptomyces sp. t39]TXS55903.1 hypothetical protein EAO77_06950 [Streptomyces sp. t39]